MMNNWDVMAPHARMTFKSREYEALHSFEETLAKIPGFKKKNGYWTVPYNALPILAGLLKTMGTVEVGGSAWGISPTAASDWQSVEKELREIGEVQDWVLDGFLTPYQEEAVAFGWGASGVHYWHSTGAGKTLTGLLCSLSRPGGIIWVTRAAARLQHAREIERFTHLSPYVIRPESELTGVIRVRGESRIDWLAKHRRGPVRVNGESYREWQARQPKAGPVRVNGESYGEWQARNKGRFSREEMKLNWSAYKEEHGLDNPGMSREEMKAAWIAHKEEHGLDNPGMSQSELSTAWAAHKEAYGIDPPKRLRNYLDECRAADRRPVIVVGWEALVGNLNQLLSAGAHNVVYDESHKGKSGKRWDVVHLPDPPKGATSREISKLFAEQKSEARGKKGFIKDTEDGRKMFLPVLNQAAAAARISRALGKRIGTTATPIKDRLRDLWSQLDLIEPNAYGNKTTFENRYCDRKPGIYGGFDTRGASNVDELKLRIDTVAHILTYQETHRHLPDKRRQSVYLAPEDQCKPTGGYAKELRDAKKRGASSLLEVKLAQAASRKRKAVIGMIEDHVSSGQKVVVFTGRRRDCDALGEAVRKAKMVKKREAQVWAAHGAQSTERRQEIIDDYMAHPGPCVLVGTGQAFGESLNIHDTDAAFFVMIPYTPGQLRQWEGRFTRLGQKRPVVIYYVIAEGTVDEHIACILIDKLPAVEALAEDSELGAAGDVLAGLDEGQTEDEWVDSILDDLDL